MPVYSTSRYTQSLIIEVLDARGVHSSAPVVRDMLYDYVPMPSDTEISHIHRVQMGDRIDRLAAQFGGDASLWWVIADVNDIFGFPLFLQTGIPLRIPTLAVFKRAQSGLR